MRRRRDKPAGFHRCSLSVRSADWCIMRQLAHANNTTTERLIERLIADAAVAAREAVITNKQAEATSPLFKEPGKKKA